MEGRRGKEMYGGDMGKVVGRDEGGGEEGKGKRGGMFLGG